MCVCVCVCVCVCDSWDYTIRWEGHFLAKHGPEIVFIYLMSSNLSFLKTDCMIYLVVIISSRM